MSPSRFNLKIVQKFYRSQILRNGENLSNANCDSVPIAPRGGTNISVSRAQPGGGNEAGA